MEGAENAENGTPLSDEGAHCCAPVPLRFYAEDGNSID